MQPALVALSLLAAQSARAAVFNQVTSHTGTGFNTAFSYQAITDPSHGRVNYVDAATAQRLNLTYANGDTFILRADHTTTLDPNGPGRNSVRMQSNVQYSNHVVVFNIRHMPEGCGTWPALWEVGDNWPAGGETDIIEGVNNGGPNLISLHTSPGCTMPASRDQSGTNVLNDCNTAANSNSGCGVHSTDSRSFGPAFNAAGGGWYAMERASNEVKVWFWSRNDAVPADVSSGATSIDTNTWGRPVAYYPDTDCDISSHFGPSNVVMNLDFCGDFAGNTYGTSGCPGSSCDDYVNNNPSAFENAYFDFAWMKVYQ